MLKLPPPPPLLLVSVSMKAILSRLPEFARQTGEHLRFE
jgi:hypothetical protein